MGRQSFFRAATFITTICSILLVPGLLPGVEPGGLTLGERAEKALVAGDTELAVELYAQWLEADPGDYSAWYNYTCALALEGMEEEALQAFDDAVTAGWRDREWPEKDPDLEILRDNPRFIEILDRISELSELEKTTVTARSKPYYLTQERLARFKVLLPANYRESGRPHPVVVLLHGRTGNMDSAEDLARRLALPEVVYILPQAPYDVEGSRDGYEYWPREIRTSGDHEKLFKVRELTARWIGDVAAEAVRELNVDPERRLLAGYSQGGSMAYVTLIHEPEAFPFAAVIGGFLPSDNPERYSLAPLAESGVKLLVLHGHRDRVIEIARAEEAVGKAREAGLPVEHHFYHGGHEISDEMVVDLADWIGKTLEVASP